MLSKIHQIADLIKSITVCWFYEFSRVSCYFYKFGNVLYWLELSEKWIFWIRLKLKERVTIIENTVKYLNIILKISSKLEEKGHNSLKYSWIWAGQR